MVARVMVKSRDEEEERLKRKRAKTQKLKESRELLAEVDRRKISKRKRKKHSEEAHESTPHISSRIVKRLQPNEHSDSSSQGHDLNSQSVSQQGGQQLLDDALFDALHDKNEQLKGLLRRDQVEITESPKKSMGNDTKEKKVKKKRDRWGQVLSNVGNLQDAVMENDMLENVEIASSGHMNGDLEANHGMCEGEYDHKTVCAGGMPYDTTEADILELFEKCGAIANVICMKFSDSQRFKGLAFITFTTEAAATKALSLDGVNMGGRHIKIEKARAGGKVLRAPPKREQGSLSVYIGNLNWDINKYDILRFFKGCAIDDVRLAVDKHTGDFRGYGHVDFSDEKSLERAIKMDQKQLLGRPAKVSYAVSKGSKESVTY